MNFSQHTLLMIKKKEFVNSKIAVEYNKNSYFFNYFVQGSTVLINRKMIKIGLPFLESVELHDRYFHLLSEFFGKRIFINKSLMKYRQHESNEIGAKGNIIKKIIEKRYFDNNDRKLIEKLKETNPSAPSWFTMRVSPQYGIYYAGNVHKTGYDS